MKLIEADKVEQAIKDYWKAQVDKLPIPKSIEEHDERVNRLDAILEHNDGLLKEIEALPSAELDTTTHDSIPAKTSKNDGDGTSGDCISRQVVAKFLDDWLFCLDENCHKQSASDLKMIIKDFKNLPSAQPEPEAVFEWKKEFKEYIESLDITRDEWKGIIEYIDELPSAEPDLGKYEYHYDHTDCIWYRPEARNRCPVTCAQYRDGWNDAMNYIFRGGKGYRPYRRGEQYEE